MKIDGQLKAYLILIVSFGTFMIAFFSFAFYMRYQLLSEYNTAIIQYEKGNYQESYELFNSTPSYLDSITWLVLNDYKLRYVEAVNLLDTEQYSEARESLRDLILSKYANEEDKENISKLIIEADYQYAIELYNNKKYEEASIIFLNLDDYKESNDYYINSLKPLLNKYREVVYTKACEYYINGDYEKALESFKILYNYSNSEEMVRACEIILNEN